MKAQHTPWTCSLADRYAVDSGEKTARSIAIFSSYGRMFTTVGIDHCWSSDMLVRPRDLADRMSDEQPLTFTLSLEAARSKAREIIDQPSERGFTPVIEKWRQLPDGQIEFAIRHFPTAD
jgi:hypothetical protein